MRLARATMALGASRRELSMLVHIGSDPLPSDRHALEEGFRHTGG